MGLLLDSEPRELSFQFEKSKRLSSSIILRNKSDFHVAFKFLSTNPGRFGVQPRMGILSPRTSCEITVKMQAQTKAPTNMRCKDKFMIRSATARPQTTLEEAQSLFKKEAAHMIEETKIRVVFTLPQAPAPSLGSENSMESSLAIASEIDRSGSIIEESAPQVVRLLEWGRNMHIGAWILKGVSFVILTSYYLLKQTLSLLWKCLTLLFFLLIKMGKKLVSESIEDWIVKTLICILMGSLTNIFMPLFYTYRERLSS